MTILDWALQTVKAGVTLPGAGAATSLDFSSCRPAGGDVSAERRKEGLPDSPNKHPDFVGTARLDLVHSRDCRTGRPATG